MSGSYVPRRGVNGAQVGAENRDRLAAYLQGLREAGAKLPGHRGRPNIQAIALGAGVDRQILYKNEGAAKMLEGAVAELGVDSLSANGATESHPSPATDEVTALQRRLASVENENLKFAQRNAALQAEVMDLRTKLRRLDHMESHMVETGRRVVR